MEDHRYDSPNVLDENILPYVIKVQEACCSLCKRKKKFFCCKNCSDDCVSQVLQQVFSASTKTFPGVVSGHVKYKVAELQKAMNKLKEIEIRQQAAVENIQKKMQLTTEILRTKKRIQGLHKVQQLQEVKFIHLMQDESTIKTGIEKLKRRNDIMYRKHTKVAEYISSKKTVVSNSKESFAKVNADLKAIRIEQVRDVATCIFPLVEIQHEEDIDCNLAVVSPSHASTNLIEQELAEARRLSYVHGRWIYDQNKGPDIIRISISSREVSAPVDGNYTACEAWLKSSRIPTSLSEDPEQYIMQLSEFYKSNGASIYATLCFSTDLMYVLQKVLGLHLPYKVFRRHFSNPDITVQEFLWNVHKLNGNVLAFCLLSGVDSQLINPLHTLSNIQNGIQMCLHNAGSTSSYRLTPDLVKSLEEALEDSSDPLPDNEEDKLEEALSEWELSLQDEDWDSFLPKESTSSNQYVSTSPFESQTRDAMEQSQGLVSSAFAWMTKGWWNK